MVTITQYGSRFDVNTGDNRLHILNAKSLEYHLKHVLKLTKVQIAGVAVALSTNNKVTIERVVA